MLERLKEICRHTCNLWDIELKEFGGEADHVHLLIAMHPSVMPSVFVNNLKTVTSRLIRKEYAERLSRFYWKPVLWTKLTLCKHSSVGAEPKPYGCDNRKTLIFSQYWGFPIVVTARAFASARTPLCLHKVS